MRVLVIDDSPLVRERLQELITEIPGISFMAQTDQSCDMVHTIETTAPDVVILDIQFPHGRGIEILEELRSIDSPMVKIMLSAFPNPLYRARCLDAGADYFLDKTVEVERITEVLEYVAAQQNATATS